MNEKELILMKWCLKGYLSVGDYTQICTGLAVAKHSSKLR